MNKKSYVTPVMTEFNLLSEQTFLQASSGASMNFGEDNHAGADLNVVSPWDQDL